MLVRSLTVKNSKTLARDVLDALATHSSLLPDVADTDCSAQYGRTSILNKQNHKPTLMFCTIKALVSCTSSVSCYSGSRLCGRFPVSVTAHVFVYIKLLSTGACANIIIREIIIITLI